MIMKQLVTGIALLAFTVDSASAYGSDTSYIAPKPVEIVIGSALGLATNAAATEALKHGIHEMRPDGSANNSFPSRHSSWIFTASTLASNYLYRQSPWYSLGAQCVATAVGAQRILARRHYASDVIAGGVCGIASAELGTFLSRKIFGRKSGLSLYDTDNDFQTSIAMTTGAVYWLNRPYDADLCTAYATSVSANIPVKGNWGVIASLRNLLAPVRSAADLHPLSATGVSFGATTHIRLPLPALALEPKAEAGISYLSGADQWSHCRIAFTGLAGCSLSWRLTEHFATSATAAFEMLTVPQALSSFTLSISSVALF